MIVVLVSLLLFICPLYGLDIQSNVSPNVATIGDTFIYTVHIRHDKAYKLISSPQASDFQPAVLTDSSIKDAGKWQLSLRYSLAFFELGEQLIPSLSFEILHANKQVKKYQLAATPIRIKSVLPTANAQQLKPYYKLLLTEEAIDWWPYLTMALLFIVAILILSLAVRIWIKKRRSKQLLASPVIIDAKADALRSLTALLEQQLLKKGLVKLHYLKLTDIVKRYLGHLYNHAIVEMTTSEALNILKEYLNKDLYMQLKTLLEGADRIKFAKYKASQEEDSQLLEHAKALILQGKTPCD